MNSMKYKLTKIVYELCKDQLDKNLTLDKCLFSWWLTGRAADSLCLTKSGAIAFDLAEIQSYTFPIHRVDDKGKIVTMVSIPLIHKKMTCPFSFYGNPSNAFIKVYDSKIAVMIQLYGSFADYIENR
jgi:hypothetical protein